MQILCNEFAGNELKMHGNKLSDKELCPCGNTALGTKDGHPFCFDCVKGATPKEIMSRIPMIKDKKFIEWLKGLGIE